MRHRPGLQPAVLVAVSASVAAAIVLLLGTGQGRTGKHAPGDLSPKEPLIPHRKWNHGLSGPGNFGLEALRPIPSLAHHNCR